MDEFDDMAMEAYTDPELRKELAATVRQVVSNLQGDARRRRNRLQQQAEKISKKVRGLRREYEMYLYQAIGRKVDFEEVKLEQGDGVQYNVVAKYIVQKDTTEPLAPRFYIDVRITAKDDEFEEGVDLTLNAGFINAIGMRHSKFTQDGFTKEKFGNPKDVFGWIEYLDGDFLKARRLVRPFGDGDLDMGTKSAAAKDIDLPADARAVLYTLSDTMPDSQDVRWALFTFGSHSLATFLDHASYLDAASLLRQALLPLFRGATQSTIEWMGAIVEARDLVDASDDFQAALMEGDAENFAPAAADCVALLARVTQKLGYDHVAKALQNCEFLIR